MEFAGRYYIAFNQDAFFQTIGLWQQLSTGQVFGAFALVIATTYCAQKLAFMMTGITFGRVSTQLSAIIPVGLIVAFLLAGEMFMLASIWGESPVATEMTSFPTPPLSVMPNTHALGQVLFTDYLYIFQTVGIILLVAMIGAIVLPQQRRPGTRKQSISDQVNRRREDAVELKKVKIGEGV
ncbi:MAG: NADH-quinone oxidoreductase subunit J [Alphaproteobacteria bacterium]